MRTQLCFVGKKVRPSDRLGVIIKINLFSVSATVYYVFLCFKLLRDLSKEILKYKRLWYRLCMIAPHMIVINCLSYTVQTTDKSANWTLVKMCYIHILFSLFFDSRSLIPSKINKYEYYKINTQTQMQCT